MRLPWTLGTAGPRRRRDLRHLESGRPRQHRASVNAPRHWAAGLQARGHEVVDAPAYSGLFGNAHLIAVDDDVLAGGTDPRPRFGAVAAFLTASGPNRRVDAERDLALADVPPESQQ